MKLNLIVLWEVIHHISLNCICFCSLVRFIDYLKYIVEVRIMTTSADPGKYTVNSTISLKGIVKAIFKDTVHVQIGGKIITLPLSKINKELN